MAINNSRRVRSHAPQFLFLILAAAIFIAASRELGSETITMTTTYPSPVGIYTRLITTGGTHTSPVNTILNRDAGYVGIGTTSQSQDIQAKLILGGDMDLNGSRVVNGTTPVNPGDLATKAYVDAAVSPGNWSCAVVSAWVGPDGHSVAVECPGPTDKVISGGCLSRCGEPFAGGPTNQGWQCTITPGSGSCAPFTAYANCCH